MSNWIMAVDEPKAIAFLEALYNLRKPESVRDEDDITTMVGIIRLHPGFAPNEAYAGLVRIRLETDHRIHGSASKHALDVIIQPYVDSGDVTEQELTNIQDEIEAVILVGGGTIDMHVALPAYFLATMIDDDTMESEGWNQTGDE